MKLCIISFKPCWRDQNGQWLSDGGFPAQMRGISSLFSQTTLVIVGVPHREGGIPLPEYAQIIPLREPKGVDFTRKVDVVLNLPYYIRHFVTHIQHADAVHIPVPGDLAFLGMLTALGMRKRLVVRYCGVWEDSSTMMNRVTKAVMRWAAGGRNVMLATGVATGSPAPNMFWSPASVISRAEIEQFRPNLDRALSSPPRLVCIGRLSEEKGVLDLLNAMALLINRNLLPLSAMPQLTFIGDGPLRRKLQNLSKQLVIEEYVHFRGQLSRADLVRELPAHDILMMPSHSESVGKARLDGMLGGLPAISTAVGSGEALIGGAGNRGWLVPKANPVALAETIAAVLQSDIDWPAMRTRCRTFVEQFTLERWTREIAEVCSRQWGIEIPSSAASYSPSIS